MHGYSYEVHYTIILPGSRVLDFSGNLRAQKLNKEQTKRANITGVQYFRGLWYFSQINRSGINFFSFIFYHFPHNLIQLLFYPCSSRQDTDAVAAIVITCHFYQGVHLLFLVPGGTYLHLEPSHTVHTRLRKY